MKPHLDIAHEPRRPWDTLEAVFLHDTDACVPWPHAKTSGDRPYGTLKDPQTKRKLRAHVLVCERTHGQRPSDRHRAGHRCGMSLCVNPRHLRWVTFEENEADKIEHGTSNRGQRNGCAKLTDEQVEAIRQRYTDGERQAALAMEYGVTQGHVSMLVNGKKWVAA